MGEDSGAVGAAAGVGCYVVTEKVHGANFCILATFAAGDTVDVCFAKRTAVIGKVADAEDFYNCRSAGLLRILAPLGEAVLRHVSQNDGTCPGAVAVHIYGELFGGRYPHPEVDAIKGLEPVQIGVWYAPDLHFMAFDIAVDVGGQPRTYLDFAVAHDVCRRCGLLFAQPLKTGTLSECIEFDIEFETTIPQQLGYPPLPPGAAGAPRNLAEGVVIRPQTEPPITSGLSAGRKESARGLFKQKISAFSEKRYQNDDWRKGKSGHSGIAAAITDTERSRYEIIANITDVRLAAVLSKIGRVDAHNKAECRRLLEDFKEDVREALEEPDAEALRNSPQLQEELDQMSRDLITQTLLTGTKRQQRNLSQK